VDVVDAVISAIVIVKGNVTNVKKKEEGHSVLDSEQVVMIQGVTAVGVIEIVIGIVTAIVIVILEKIFANRDYRSGGLHKIQASAFT